MEGAKNINQYKTDFAPSFGQHAKTYHMKREVVTHNFFKGSELYHQEEDEVVKEVNISNIDSDEEEELARPPSTEVPNEGKPVRISDSTNHGFHKKIGIHSFYPPSNKQESISIDQFEDSDYN